MTIARFEQKLTFFVFLVSLFSWTTIQAQPELSCTPVSGIPPVIDGSIGAGEWPSTPSFQLTSTEYPIEAGFSCVHDAENVYVLVDATGDMTETNYDECLLVFDLPQDHKIVEVWKNAVGELQTRFEGGASGEAMLGFDGHRVYEFRIDRASIGFQSGASLPLYSPAMLKAPGIIASMPYDAESFRDNVFPKGLVVEFEDMEFGKLKSVSGYALLTAVELAQLDIDVNGAADALTDGLLVLRRLFGLSGDVLVKDALAPDATRTDPGEIADAIAAAGDAFDIDLNGDVDALTDGLLILRYLFGLTGTALVKDALAPDATRTDPAEIAAAIQAMM